MIICIKICMELCIEKRYNRGIRNTEEECEMKLQELNKEVYDDLVYLEKNHKKISSLKTTQRKLGNAKEEIIREKSNVDTFERNFYLGKRIFQLLYPILTMFIMSIFISGDLSEFIELFQLFIAIPPYKRIFILTVLSMILFIKGGAGITNFGFSIFCWRVLTENTGYSLDMIAIIIFYVFFFIALALRISDVYKKMNKKEQKKEDYKIANQQLDSLSSDEIIKEYQKVIKKYGCDVDSDIKAVLKGMDSHISFPNIEPYTQKDLGLKHFYSDEVQRVFSVLKHKETIERYIHDNSDVIKMTNPEKEEYLNFVQRALKIIPEKTFNIVDIERAQTSAVFTRGKDFDISLDIPNVDNRMFSCTKEIISILRIFDSYPSIWKEFNLDCKGTFIGEEGERSVLEELKFFSNQMKVLTNIRLEVNGQSVESDIIVIAPSGIFAVEVKNLGSTGSYNITIEKDGLWKKVMKNGRFKPMGSVSRQNLRHLHGIEQVVNSKISLENWIEAHSIIVFANDVVGIRNYSDNVVVRASEMMKEIRKYPRILTEKQIEEIADILQKETLPLKKYEVKNWYKLLVTSRLEMNDKADYVIEIVKPCLDFIRKSQKFFPGYSLSSTKRMGRTLPVPTISLEDDYAEYQKSDEEIRIEAEEQQKEKLRKYEEERAKRIREQEDEASYISEQSNVDELSKMMDAHLGGEPYFGIYAEADYYKK